MTIFDKTCPEFSQKCPKMALFLVIFGQILEPSFTVLAWVFGLLGVQKMTSKSGHSGKQRTKKEAAQNTNHHNPGGHERKIVTKLQNMEANQRKKENK